MHTESDFESQQDRKISQRFAVMRQRDAAGLPGFPDAEELSTRAPMEIKKRFNIAVPAVAAGIAIAVFTALLMMNMSPRDPGVLYADIMASNTITTDYLMVVSPGTSPEMINTMGAYEIDVSIGAVQEIN